MKLKLDENLGRECADAPRKSGHEVTTVHEQGLGGIGDHRLIRLCADEQRCLVTLDVEFGDPVRFTPAEFAGIAVLRVPGRISRENLRVAVETLAETLGTRDIHGKLWIVQPGRIREHQEE